MTRVEPITGRSGDLGDRRFAPVPASAPQPPLSSLSHAGVVTRVLAACVDAVAVFLLAVAFDLGAAGVRFAWSPVTFRWPQPDVGLSVLVLLTIAVLYLTGAWAVAGRTYGARLLGLRLLSTRHALLGWTRSFLRALACVALPVGLLWSGVSSKRLSVQDLVFRSVVVYDSNPYVHPEATPTH
jgi:RDD family